MQPHFDARAHAYALRSLIRRTMRDFLATVHKPDEHAAGDAALTANRAAVTAWRNFARVWHVPRAADLRAGWSARRRMSLASGRSELRWILAGPYRAGRAFLRRCDPLQSVARPTAPGEVSAQFIGERPCEIARDRAAYLLRAARSRSSAPLRVAPGVYFIGGAGLRLAIGARAA